ncbi:MAG: hypothetical protein L6R37_000712 [Teloschistes peruensis]|nr:MAG: hypothetical protein L6R37_000712 [Teloschistes peruensis]
MAAKSVVFRHYERALAQWPVDALRPQISFQNVIRGRIEKQLGPASDKETSYDPSKESKDTLVTPLKPYDEKAEMEQVNALYSLLENRYAKQYPLSERTMKPLSKPTYYEDFINELEEAPKRSWLERYIHSWKGFIRWQ